MHAIATGGADWHGIVREGGGRRRGRMRKRKEEMDRKKKRGRERDRRERGRESKGEGERTRTEACTGSLEKNSQSVTFGRIFSHVTELLHIGLGPTRPGDPRRVTWPRRPKDHLRTATTVAKGPVSYTIRDRYLHKGAKGPVVGQ